MGRWSWRRNQSAPPERLFGPATNFAAGTGCYAKDALPAWVTEPTDEQPGVDPWAQAASGDSVPDQGDNTAPPAAPPNRSARFGRTCGADRGYPPGWS